VTDKESDVESAVDADDLEELSDEDLLDEEVLEDDLDVVDDLEDDVGLEIDLDDDDVVIGEVIDAVPIGVVVAEPAGDSDESSDEEDDELDDDEVEAGLDVILKERLVVADEDEAEDEEEEDAVDVDDRGEGTTRVLPKQPGEFVCQSCFLVKSETQLADPKRQFCRDCV
jgi:hypothetical protein